MTSFQELKKSLKNDVSGLKKIKVALLGDTATQFLVKAIKGMGVQRGYDLNIWEADFNQIDRQVLDPGSELYDFNPDFVILFRSTHKLLAKYNKKPGKNRDTFAADELADIKNGHQFFSSQMEAKVICYNYPEIDDTIFGNFANKIESSFLFQLRKLNFEMLSWALSKSNLFIGDLSSVQNQLGKSNMFTPSIYVNTEMVLSLDALPTVAARTVDIIQSLDGKLKKCLILDLDNTVWGGVIGDDGIENIQIGDLGIGKAFTEFQYWVKKLKDRGIIIAVCSKNTDSVAKEPFEKHPDMVLRLEDISVFVANWDNKADNIRHIQGILNIGFDAMVFLDDNPFERNIVRENIPDITVPELPEDPAAYLEYLYTLNLFETTSFSGEDSSRTKMYQQEAERVSVKQQFTNEDDFLKTLEMTSEVAPFNAFNSPRVAQLSQRSNQFNLRTIRYNESEIKSIAESVDYLTFTFTLSDKFGENGLISVIILKLEENQTAFVDTWIMSCRVLKRGMERFVLNSLMSALKEKNIQTLKGEYLKTSKNALVKDHYKQLGFLEQEGFWLLDVPGYKNLNTHIKRA